MFCSRCGTWLPDEAAACSLCGLVLRADAPGVGFVAPVASPASHAPVATPVSYAGFWRRFVAILIDLLVTFFPIATMRVVLGLSPTSMLEPVSAATSWAGLFELVFDWLYAAILISSSWRGTLGQQVMDLHVTDVNGGRVSFARATFRYLAQLLNFFTLGFGVLMQVFSPRRQCLHDLVSGTVVVRPRPAPELAPVMRLVP